MRILVSCVLLIAVICMERTQGAATASEERAIGSDHAAGALLSVDTGAVRSSDEEVSRPERQFFGRRGFGGFGRFGGFGGRGFGGFGRRGFGGFGGRGFYGRGFGRGYGFYG